MGKALAASIPSCPHRLGLFVRAREGNIDIPLNAALLHNSEKQRLHVQSIGFSVISRTSHSPTTGIF